LDRFSCEEKNGGLSVSLTVENTGSLDGAEVVQIYLSGRNCDVVMPMKELKAYKRVEAAAGGKTQVVIEVPNEAFWYYDRKMKYGMHNGDYTVSVATSCVDVKTTFEVSVKDGKLIVK
jgi:beta-glucosidase